MYADTFDEATRPYQFALQTRAGTDALSGMLHATVDLDSAATIVSLDGRSAYDTISRTAFLNKLHHSSRLCAYGTGSNPQYFWWDADGQRRTILQKEGANRDVDALAPALYALGQHDALVAADAQLRPGECLAAAGVAANLGKTRVYNRDGGPAPPGIAELGANVWRGDAPAAERGFVALGTPLGHPRFVAAHTDTRLLEKARLLQELPLLPDLQCAWLLLAMCASPRADHILRTLPTSPPAMRVATTMPSWRCLLALPGEENDADPEVAAARRLAMLPARLGGLGLQCAERTAPAAFTGPPGPTHCPSCARAAPTLLPAASQNSLPKRLAVRSKVPDGRAALILGTMYTTAVAPHNATFLNLARGARDGSTMVPACSIPASRWQHSTATPGGARGSGASLEVNVRSW